MKIYSILDQKSGLYSRPHFANTNGEVLRQFMDVANDKNTNIGLHPEDYYLYHVGEWDDKTGSIIPEALNVMIGKAIDYISQEPEKLRPRKMTELRKGDPGYEEQIKMLKGTKDCPERSN